MRSLSSILCTVMVVACPLWCDLAQTPVDSGESARPRTCCHRSAPTHDNGERPAPAQPAAAHGCFCSPIVLRAIEFDELAPFSLVDAAAAPIDVAVEPPAPGAVLDPPILHGGGPPDVARLAILLI